MRRTNNQTKVHYEAWYKISSNFDSNAQPNLLSIIYFNGFLVIFQCCFFSAEKQTHVRSDTWTWNSMTFLWCDTEYFRSSFDRFNEIELKLTLLLYMILSCPPPSPRIHTITCTKCFVNNFSILVMQSKQRETNT